VGVRRILQEPMEHPQPSVFIGKSMYWIRPSKTDACGPNDEW
jgi:hypothetical protein